MALKENLLIVSQGLASTPFKPTSDPQTEGTLRAGREVCLVFESNLEKLENITYFGKRCQAEILLLNPLRGPQQGFRE